MKIFDDLPKWTKDDRAPRRYQQECIAQLKGSYDAGDKKGLISLATGMGKTYVGCSFLKWLYENNIALPPAQREGFCNLASAFIYKQDGSTFSTIHLNSMDTDTDPNYGDGYRKMKIKLKKNGWESVLKIIKE